MHPQTMKSLANAREFMRSSYGARLTLPDVSARANLSPYHFLPVHKEAFRETPREVVEQKTIGPGVFETDDIHGDYELLKKRGVEFSSPPEEQYHVVQAVLKDDSGNYFSLQQYRR